MSYILEALKKAEAERQGTAQRTPAPPVFTSSAARPSRPGSRALWMAVPVIAMAAAATAWWTMSREDQLPTSVAQAPAASPALRLPPPPDVNSIPAEEPAKPAPKQKEKSVEKPVAKKTPESPSADKAERKKDAPTEAPVLTLRQLPDHIQREIPPLTIGGYIFSGNKADRSVLINKRLLREGDEIAPGLTLEAMQPNGMILVYKGYRYRTGY